MLFAGSKNASSLKPGSSPGGSGTGDTIARLMADRLGKKLNATVIVDNRGGANGNIGASAAAAAAADGYKLLFSWAGTLAVNPSLYRNLSFDPQRSFAPIVLVADVPNIMVVNNEMPTRDLADFVRYAKANPERLNFGSTGNGSSMLDVDGVDQLGGAEHTFADDFHEVATFLALGAVTGGSVAVKNGSAAHFPLLDRTFAKFGVELEHGVDGFSRAHAGRGLKVRPTLTAGLIQKVEAAPWPYVPADLRDPHRLVVRGGTPLRPAVVESPYIIRVAIALLMVAASIEGRSVIRDALPIRRAHPRFAENLNALGAEIAWAEDESSATQGAPHGAQEAAALS